MDNGLPMKITVDCLWQVDIDNGLDVFEVQSSCHSKFDLLRRSLHRPFALSLLFHRYMTLQIIHNDEHIALAFVEDLESRVDMKICHVLFLQTDLNEPLPSILRQFSVQ